MTDRTEYNRQWHLKNKERISIKKKAQHKANPEAARARCYKNKYDITIADYHVMFLEQDGVCKICSKPEPTNVHLAVDHCHTTGKVRGLLCTPCNKALGLFEDKQDSLLNAISYLKSSSN